MSPRGVLAKLFGNQFLRFLAVGAVNTLFGYGIYALLITVGLHYAIAALCSTVLGVVFNFKTTGILVFRSRRNALIVRFALVYAVIYGCNVAGLWLLTSIHTGAIVAGAILALPLAVLSYTLNRSLVFRQAQEG